MKATGKTWRNSQAEQRSAPVEDNDWPPMFGIYTRIVESCPNQARTYPKDIVPAFEDNPKGLPALCEGKLVNDLIENVIDYSLLRRSGGW